MIYQIIYDVKDLNMFFKTLEILGDFVLVNKTVFLYTELEKQELIDKLNSEVDDGQFIVKEVDINSQEIDGIRSWIGKVIIPKPKEVKSSIEIMHTLIDDIEKNLELQLKQRSDGESE